MPCRNVMRSLTIGAGVALVAMMCAASALAARIPIGAEAFFRTTISGTFSSTGHDSGVCTDPNSDPNQDAVTHPTATTVEDRVAFTSTKAGIADVTALPELGAGMTRNARVHAHWTRSRTTTAGGPCPPDPRALSCGARDNDFPIGIFANANHDALGYDLRAHNGPLFPDDPFGSDCATVDSETSWGKLDTRGTPVSRTRIFNRRVKKIVLHGVERSSSPRQGGTADSSSELRYTIKLVRRKR